jgi:membrane protease subunit HflK
MNQEMPFDLSQFRPRQIHPKYIGWAAIGVVILILLFSSVFTIDPEEVGVILRFGKFTRTVNPGLNFKLPFGIETVQKVAVERQLKEEFGFRTLEAGQRTRYSERDFIEESLMLTGDLNAADVEWIVQYRIEDPYKFLFKVRNAQQTFRDMNEAIVREVIGDRSIDEVITVGRTEISNTVAERLQELSNQYEIGIKVDQVVLQDVNPPDAVKPAFNEVNEAEQERDKLINQARSEYNKVIPAARGEAAKTIEEAKGYALERVNNAQGEASKFNSVYAEYRKAKEVTEQRIYLETLNDVLQKVGKKLITDQNATGILPLFDLSKGVTK